MNIETYLYNLQTKLQTGKSTEHTFRADLQAFIGALNPSLQVINEPARQACGAPDYVILKNGFPLGYIEAKDIPVNLDEVEKTDQLARYKKSLNNLILTNYIDFRFFKNGAKVAQINIATVTAQGLVPQPGNYATLLNLLQDFIHYQGQTISSAKQLANLMAQKAVLMRDVFEKIVLQEKENSLKNQLRMFKKVLLHDLDEKTFADVYAQTITYGLFVARLHDPTPDTFSRQEARDLISHSNPFLRSLFDYISGANLDDNAVWIVDDLVSIFKHADVRGIMARFGVSDGLSDPFLHFYETFLTAYDKEAREKRGVYYTPQPVVQFIVRAVDDILQKEFNLPHGLATHEKITVTQPDELDGKPQKISTHKVQILDPATGTGTFLAEAIKLIYSKFTHNQGMWPKYVEEHLIPRLNGFELLMTPYVMCHLKLEMLLQETGYTFTKDNRFHVYLSNSLEKDEKDTPQLFADWIADEAYAAKRVKNNTPIMVVMGNPPYSVSSCNKNEFIDGLVYDYKKNLNERNIQPLSDDYIKFIRLGEHFIETNREGVLAYITNNSFLDGLIHRQMRHHLLETFDKIYILNLHGNSKRKETTPDGSKDENVFNIMAGVSINLLIKTGKKKKNALADVFYADLYGTRSDKFAYLQKATLANMRFTKLTMREPHYFFVPKDFTTETKYKKGFKLDEIFTTSDCGISTSKDSLNVRPTPQEIQQIKDDLLELPENDFRIKYKIGSDSRDWSVSRAKQDVLNHAQSAIIVPYSYRPFDVQCILFTAQTNGLVAWPRGRIMSNFIHGHNYALYASKINRQISLGYVFIGKTMVDRHILDSAGDTTHCIPLYLYTKNQNEYFPTREPNLNKDIIRQLEMATKLTFVPEEDGQADHFSPMDVLDYMYGVLHSHKYRTKYQEFLKIDFPRIPYPTSADYFRQVATLGKEIRLVHLLEHPCTHLSAVTYPINGLNVVDKITYENGKVFINKNQYFDNVPQTAWEFYIGGYQPAQKWLKDRKGKALSFEELQHYPRVIAALQKTHELMQEIDKVVKI